MSQVLAQAFYVDDAFDNCKKVFEETNVDVSQLINNCSDQFIKCIFPEDA